MPLWQKFRKGTLANMNIFYTPTTAPSYNLALEEYLFKNSTDSYFFLWQNNNAVIIGKNQVALKEVDSRLADQNSTHIVRRMTGGGAVYHDMGNVNYSYIVNSEDKNDKTICFERYTEAVIRYLETLGIKAEFGGRNDILLDGKKISGNAQHIFAGRVLHHGTLLFDADLEYASSVLTPESKKMQGKGVASVKSRITNIREHLENDIPTDEFIKGLLNFIGSEQDVVFCEPTEEQKKGALKLEQERYSAFGWNFGASPRYDLYESKRFDFGTVTVSMDVKNALIADIAITGDFFGTADIAELCARLKGLQHEQKVIEENVFDISDFISGMSTEEFVSMLF